MALTVHHGTLMMMYSLAVLLLLSVSPLQHSCLLVHHATANYYIPLTQSQYVMHCASLAVVCSTAVNRSVSM